MRSEKFISLYLSALSPNPSVRRLLTLILYPEFCLLIWKILVILASNIGAQECFKSCPIKMTPGVGGFELYLSSPLLPMTFKLSQITRKGGKPNPQTRC